MKAKEKRSPRRRYGLWLILGVIIGLATVLTLILSVFDIRRDMVFAVKNTIVRDDYIANAAWSPDESRIFVQTSGANFSTWDTQAQLIQEMYYPELRGFGIDWNKQGTYFTQMNSNGVLILDMDGNVSAELSHPGLFRVDWSSTGERLTTTSGYEVKLWRADAYQLSQIDAPINADSYEIYWSPDGQYFLTRSIHTMSIWTKDGELVKSFEWHDPTITTHLVWSNDSSAFALALGSFATEQPQYTVQIYTLTGDVLAEIMLEDKSLNAIEWSPDSSLIDLIVYSNQATMIEVYNRNADLLIARDNSSRVAWQPGGQRFLVIPNNPCTDCLLLSDLQGNIIRSIPDESIFYYLADVTWSPDGEHFATWTTTPQDGYFSLYIWDDDGNLVQEMHQTTSIQTLAWSPDSQEIVAYGGFLAHIWSITGNEIGVLRHAQPINYVRWSADGTRLMSSAQYSAASSIETAIWKADATHLATLNTGSNFQTQIAEVNSDFSQMLVNSGNRVEIRELQPGSIWLDFRWD